MSEQIQIPDIPQEISRLDELISLGELITIHRIALREIITDSDTHPNLKNAIKQSLEEKIKRLEQKYVDLAFQKVDTFLEINNDR